MNLQPPRRLSRQLLTATVACCLAALCASTALAKPKSLGPPWLKLDRVQAEPSWLDGVARVRLYVTAVTLEGGVIPITGKNEWVLQIGSSKKKQPYLVGQFKGVQDDDLAVMLVIDTSSFMANDLPAIKEAAAAFIDALPKDASVGVIGYSEEVEGDRRPGNKSRAQDSLSDLDADTVPTKLNLVKAVDYAVKGLRKAKSKDGRGLRKMIIVVSDGQDEDHSAARFRSVAKKAERQDIRIHTFAYSTGQDREPMRGLAELSKVTFGTFRLVYSSHSFAGNFEQLLAEIEQQYVLTYYVPTEDIEGKKVKLLAKDMVSNDGKAPKVECGKESCGSGVCAAGTCVTRGEAGGRGILGWILVIGGGLIGVLVLLVGVGFVLTRRHEQRAARQALAGAIAENAAAAAPDHRIVAQGPQGGVVAQPHRAPAPHGQIQGQVGGRVQPQGYPQPGPAAAPGVPTFVILTGAHKGRTVALSHGFRIGKAPDCHLSISDDGFASTYHAHIEVDKGGGCTLVDEHSTNGTFVNGVRAVRQRLSSGMLVKVGSTEMRYMQG